MRALQPVTIFSHKPLEKFEELGEVCKVLDIAVIPDKPGVCVAVTETYHDVASYHMLHADRKKVRACITVSLFLLTSVVCAFFHVTFLSLLCFSFLEYQW
jgi:hypothetical protein